jgi:hypothetical protein
MSRIIPVALLLLFSCVEPVSLKLASKEGQLVLDGQVTNWDERQIIKLSRSLSIDNTRIPPAYLIPETGAQITVIENETSSVLFTETTAGTYAAPISFKGTIGNSYQIDIITQGGDHYQSGMEIMPTSHVIADLPYEYVVYERFQENASGVNVSTKGFGFALSATVNDPPDVRNHYRWKVKGIFEFFSITDVSDLQQCWAPVSRSESNVLVKDDGYVNGQTFTEPLVIIPYDRATLFQATVQQQSLTTGAYNFWKGVKQQQLNTGSIFDPVPSPIAGNIINVNDPAENVLGYFSATAITEKIVLINRFHASGSVSPSPHILPLPGDCRNHWPQATNIKPPGFP